MNFSWQQRVLLLVSAQLLVTSLPAVASSFVTPASTMKSPAFGKRNGRYNPLLRVSPGGDDSASADNQEIGEPAAPVANDPAPVAEATPSLLGPNAKSPPGFFRSKLPKLPWHKFPDYLTYARCLAIPAFVTLFYSNMDGKSHLYTGTIFAFASITDWLDGFLARRWDVSTAFGAFLDPVADKLMVSTSLILLAGRYGAIAAIPTLIILAREIAVSALREWMAQRGERDTVKVGYQGKVKTALTMTALTILLFVPASAPTSAILYKIGMPLLYLSSVITITSGSVYFIAAAPALLNKK
jgi:CDP-diacylglycerol--glycerol-3-phosphate 3-phosphatidyltransferase